jgi:predicted PurR-regulated permease PerM
VILVVVVPVMLLAGVVTNQAIEVSQTLAPEAEELVEKINEPGALSDRIPFWDRIEPYSEQIAGKLGQLAGSVGSFLVSSLSAMAGGAMRFFFGLFIMLYALFSFLIYGREAFDDGLRLIPLHQSDKELLIDTFVSVSRATLKGTLVIGVVQGALAGLAFAAVGIDGAAFWGTVMAVLSVIPGIGTALVWAPAVAVLFINGQIVAAAALFLWCAIVVGLADNVLRPRLVGRDTQMPDLLVLLSTFGGLAMFGAIGLVLGPVVAALFLAVVHIYSDTFSEALTPSPDTTDGG